MALGSYSPEALRFSMASRSLRQNRQSGAGGSRPASCLEEEPPENLGDHAAPDAVGRGGRQRLLDQPDLGGVAQKRFAGPAAGGGHQDAPVQAALAADGLGRRPAYRPKKKKPPALVEPGAPAVKAVYAVMRLTFSALGPFGPCVTSNSTSSPSARVLKPSPRIEL